MVLHVAHAIKMGLASRVRSKGHGKAQIGSLNFNSKLSEERVVEMKRRLLSGEPVASVAREFGVTGFHAREIRAGRRWAHL